MKVVKVRKLSRGEQIIVIPRELAKQMKSPYMSVEIDNDGRLMYSPILEGA